MRNPFSCAATGDYASSPQASGGLPQRHAQAHQGAGVQRPHRVDFLFNKPANTTPPAPVPVPADARGAAPGAGPQPPVPAGPFDGAAEAARRLADRSGVQRARLSGAVPGTEALSCPADFPGRAAAATRRDPVARSLRPPRPSRHQGAGETRPRSSCRRWAWATAWPPGVSADRIRQFDWWQDVEIDGLRLTARRPSIFRTQPRRQQSHVVVVLGDRGRRAARLLQRRQRLFRRLRRNRPALRSFDLTLMETGAYDPQWPYVHMQPTETVQAHQDLRGRWLLPIQALSIWRCTPGMIRSSRWWRWPRRAASRSPRR